MFVKEGRIRALGDIWFIWSNESIDYKVVLFLADFTESDDLEWIGDMEETERAEVALTRDVFTDAPAVVGDNTDLVGTRVDYENESSGSVTIYGWGVIGSSWLYNAQKLESPVLLAEGETYSFRPVIRCADLGL